MRVRAAVVRAATGLAIAGVVGVSVQANQSSPAVAATVAAPTRTARAADFSDESDSATDVAVNGIGAADGYHLRVASGDAGFGWRDVAVLRPAALDPSTWYGYQCVTDDGKYVAVAVLPGDEINDNVSRDRGAYAYSVNIASGKVTTLASGVGLKYHSPGCGVGDTAAFTANLGSDEASTEALAFDLKTGQRTQDSILAGQITSVVPVGSGLVGAQGASIVSIPVGGSPSQPGKAKTLVAAGGDAYDLRPSASGGVDFLAGDAKSATAKVQQLDGSTVHTVGSGPASDVALFAGAGGHNQVVGAQVSAARVTERDYSALPLRAETMSLDGQAAFGATRNAGDAKLNVAPSTQTEAAAQASLPVVESETTHKAYTAAGAAAPTATSGTSTPTSGSPTTSNSKTGATTQAGKDRKPFDAQPAPSERGAKAVKRSGFVRTGASTLSVQDALVTRSAVVVNPALSADATTPKCSIPRLQPNLEAMQPSNAQVNWATQMDEQGLLTGSQYTRPANFANMGLVAYAPSSDFPPVQLSHPSGSTTTTVPRSVMLAIEAQESNFNQASWHALPGIAGDPLIADYYGVVDSISTIDYPNADCGYGVAQVTTGMAASDTSISTHGEMKIAVDYQENIAAGLQILEKTWNSLYADGITANGGDPKYLENWYFAAWAYNTGIQPNAAFGNTSGCTPSASCTGPDGTWGVGWSNNPQNPDYDPARKPYLQSTYADAAHPSGWPYQERIMGWMASPILRYGYYGYNTPTYNGGSSWLQIPPVSAFCDSSDDCNPGDSAKQYCSLSDSECWWHKPVTWVASCSMTCTSSAYEYTSGSTEPAYTAKYTPTCSQDTSKVPSGSIIVDDLSTPSQDDQGCSGINWSNNGTFTYSPGTNSSGDPVGNIDTHQLGSGFGGHILFTHTEPASSTSVINTGTWTPTLPSKQYYKVKIHVPASGATATDLVYTINPGGGAAPWKIRVNQDWGSEQWVTIGTFGMQNGGSVVLTNASSMTAEKYDVAYDAVAFVPEGGDASTPLGGPPGIQDEPAGSNPAWVNCGCGRRTAGDPVDTATGYFGESGTDLSTAGLGEPLTIHRTYSAVLADATGPAGSAATVNGAFGYGWTFNYGMTATTDSSGNVAIHQEDGSAVPFTVSGSGTYAPSAPRYAATLTKSGSTYVFTRRGNDQFIFDTATGHLLSESDLAGRAASPAYSTTLSYNSAAQLATVTDPGKRTYTFTWTGTHITKIMTSGAQEVDYTYSSAGDLTDVYGIGTTRSGSTTLGNQDHAQYAYNTKHLMVTERSPANYGKTTSPTPVTANVYDASDRVTSQTDPDGNTTTFTYGPDSTTGITTGQTLVTNPAGHKTVYAYTNGLLASETRGSGTSAAATTSYQYDPATLGITVQTNPDGTTQTASFDDAGNKASSSDGLGRTTSYAYNTTGQPTAETDPSGLETQWTYNTAGAVTSITKSDSGQSAESANNTLDPTYSRQSTNTYSDATHPAEPTATTDPAGNTTTYTYDAFGDTTSATDPLSRTTKIGWNTALGVKTTTVSAAGVAAGTTTACAAPTAGCTTFAYDAFENIITTTDPLGHTTKASFDADGNQLTATNGNNHTTTTTYDAADRAVSVTKPSGSKITTTYNSDGTVAKTTNAQGAVTSYTYDARGDQVTATNPDGKTTKNSWTSNGQIQTTTDPNGTTTTVKYDSADESIGRSYSDSTAPVTYMYDTAGRRVAMTDGTGTSTYVYDVFGELTTETNGAGSATGYGYDADGRTTSIRYPGTAAPTATRNYDAAGELTSVTDPGGTRSSFGYTVDGAPTTENLGNSDTITTTYDADDRVSNTALSKAGTALGTVGVTRDGVGDILTQTPSAGAPGPTVTNTYTSDQYLSTSTTTSTTTLAYDAAGNPTSTAAGSAAYDAAGQLCWTSSTAFASPACGTAPSGATKYGFDADGNRTSATTSAGTANTLTYDGGGELTSATSSGTTLGSYTYDGDGLRTSKTTTAGTQQFTWDGRGSLPVMLSDGTIDYITGPTGAVLEQWSANGATWLFKDAHGSTVAVLGSTGAVSGSYAYSPSGIVISHTGASTPIQFADAYVDLETGFFYLQARYYDPATSLFISSDPRVAVTHQAYTYAANDPLNDVDPMGLWPWTLVAAGVSVITGIAGVALDGTAVGAVIGLPLEGISLVAGGFAIAGDCYGAFGAEREAVGCGLDWLAEGTAGFGVAAEGINAIRGGIAGTEAAEDAARASEASGYTLGRTSRLEREARAAAREDAEWGGLKYAGKGGDWTGLLAGGAGIGWSLAQLRADASEGGGAAAC
jgi:RHS repeat-associated protein